MGTQLVEWANELVNHTSITKDQKEKGITAYQEQFNTKDTLYEAYGINIATWGELCYVYVLKKNRAGKLSPRAVRCIWNGANNRSQSTYGNPNGVTGAKILIPHLLKF